MTTLGTAGSAGLGTSRVVVTVGTDHHPFDRLVGWINEWLGEHPEQAPEFFMQSGPTSLVPACPSSQFLDVGQLNAQLNAADLMICHGGPGSISDAWSRGHLPIVVPRLRRFGEVVDDHQVDFCLKLAELGRVRLAQTPAALAGLLDEAAHDTGRFRTSGAEADIAAAIARFATLVDELVSRPPSRLSPAFRIRRTRHTQKTDNGNPVAVATPAAGARPGSEYELAGKRFTRLRRSGWKG
jgi:UDP-N-acetylglucosamine transferase subunit ALG13